MSKIYTDKERRPYYALLISILTDKTVSESLSAMKIKEGQDIDDMEESDLPECLAPNYQRCSWMIQARGHARKSRRGW